MKFKRSPLSKSDSLGVSPNRARDAKSDGGTPGTDYSANNEGIEVQAIEFDKPNLLYAKPGKRSPRKLILFIFAFVVILAASAIAGFGVLRNKKKSTLIEASEINTSTESEGEASTESEEEAKDSVDTLIVSNHTEDQESTLSPTDAVSQVDTSGGSSGGSSWGSSSNSFEALWSDNISEESSSVVEPPPGDDVSSESGSSLSQPGSDNISSLPGSSGGDELWSDPVCPDHNLAVSSTCSTGASSSISTASFCFGSKRDGDWYWIRSSADAATAYDSWDYTEETQGQLTITNLAGGSYIISLVRDSMAPYDEIISHEFTVPECQ